MPKEARWKHLGPCQHVVQFYESDEDLIDTLEAFLGTALLEQRLHAAGIDLAKVRAADRYIPLDAEKLFELFMHGGRFDSEGFFEVARNALERCRGSGRSVRVFGELVAVMWAHKHYATALRLEEAWQAQCKASKLSVLCSYPFAGISEDSARMIPDICAAHTEAVFQ
jgi:hypothetical protein